MIIPYTQAKAIASYLMEDCSEAAIYRDMVVQGLFGPLSVETIHRELILERWGKQNEILVDDIAYNESLMLPDELAFNPDEIKRFRTVLATAFLESIWEEVSEHFNDAIIEYHAARKADEETDRYMERMIE